MARKNPSGIALLNQRNSQGKNYTNPEFTQRFLDGVLAEGLEGKEPPEGLKTIWFYHGRSYTIDREGRVRGLNGEPMKPMTHPQKKIPFVRIHKTYKEGEKFVDKEVEVNILSLMESAFGSYFSGSRLAKSYPGQYILVPKDENWANLHRSNLHYVNKKEYNEEGTKRAVIKMRFRMNPQLTDQEIEEKTGFSRSHIYRVRQELIQAGLLSPNIRLEQLRAQTGIQISTKMLPIYEYFCENGGDLPNLEIAKILFPEMAAQAKTNYEKKILTADIVRVRKKLRDCGFLAESRFQEQRDRAVEMLQQKAEIGLTHQEIADQLGLKKEQIDNLSRALNKGNKSDF